jgi:methyl-accepting chemotaxis protein
MNKLSLKAKLLSGFGALLVVVCGMALAGYMSISRLSVLSAEVTKQARKAELAFTTDDGFEMQTNGMRAYLLTGEEEMLKHRDEGMEQAKKGMDELGPLLQTERGKALYATLQTRAAALDQMQRQAIELRRTNRTQAAVDLIFSPEARKTRAEMDDITEELQKITHNIQQKAEDEHETAKVEARELMLGLMVVGLLVSIVIPIFVLRSIIGSVTRMLGLIEEIADKNLAIEDMEIASNDELGRAGTALNGMKNNLHEVVRTIAETAQHVASAAEELSATSQQISANSEETSTQANVVSQAVQQVAQNLQSVSTGAEEMTSTIQSIATNAHEAATVASNAVHTAQAANATVGKLGESSAEIGEVIKVITSIAQQTNLLALNATIEAARAGEAGKGFAVVANEVKELAKQTAKATEDISRKISAIQSDTKGAVDAIGSISGVITQVNDISGTIATAVEEQSATTNEMTRNVADAAKGSGEITRNIGGVAEAAQGTSTSAQESQKAANELAEMAVRLNSLVGQFKIHQASDPAAASPPPRPRQKTLSARAGA